MKLTAPKCLLTVPRNSALFSELWSSHAQTTLQQSGLDISFIDDAPSSIEGWRYTIAGYDAIITSWTTPQINSDILHCNDTLRIVGHAAGSVADLVSDELYERNIKITTANDIMAQEVATWCLSMTLFGIRNYLKFACIGGNQPLRWDKIGEVGFIQDAVIGIWGYGAISKHYINYLKPLKPAKIFVNDDFCCSSELASQGLKYASLEEVFAHSDVIVLLESLTPDSINRIDANLLSTIKNGASLLNSGRAELVQHKPLMAELHKQRFFACLDVFHNEPLPPDDELQRLNNVILTPHNGGRASRSRYVSVILEEFHRYFKNQPLLFEVTRQRARSMTSHKMVSNNI
jgi:phosphoglycerate dehydrogenase-like enzyme